LYYNNKNNNKMKVTKIQQGVYKVVDSQGTWIAKGGCATVNGEWGAWDCDNYDDCTNSNSWAVSFKTFKQLKQFSQSF